MMTIAVPVIVAVVGLLIYGLGKDKMVEVGRIVFAVGLFFAVAAVAGQTFQLP